MSQRKFGIALLITALLCVIPASVAYASLTANSSSVSAQSISTSNWSANAGANSSAMPTGSAYGPIILSNSSACTSITKVTIGRWSANDRKITVGDTAAGSNAANLVVGMRVSGVGISQSGLNTISQIDFKDDEITLSNGPNTSPRGTTLTFVSGSCTWDQYLSINNKGLTDFDSFTMTATSTSTSGNSISLVACLGGTWNESTDVCSGNLQTLTTTIGTGTGANSPQSVSVTIPLLASGTIRLRAVATQSSSSLTVGVSVARVNLRTVTLTNG